MNGKRAMMFLCSKKLNCYERLLFFLAIVSLDLRSERLFWFFTHRIRQRRPGIVFDYLDILFEDL